MPGVLVFRISEMEEILNLVIDQKLLFLTSLCLNFKEYTKNADLYINHFILVVLFDDLIHKSKRFSCEIVV